MLCHVIIHYVILHHIISYHIHSATRLQADLAAEAARRGEGGDAAPAAGAREVMINDIVVILYIVLVINNIAYCYVYCNTIICTTIVYT